MVKPRDDYLSDAHFWPIFTIADCMLKSPGTNSLPLPSVRYAKLLNTVYRTNLYIQTLIDRSHLETIPCLLNYCLLTMYHNSAKNMTFVKNVEY